MNDVIRKSYLDFLISAKDTKVIKVISGVRRCGKSTLLLQFCEYLSRQGVEENNVLHINFENMDYRELFHHEKLHDYVTTFIKGKKKCYVFLDEIQNVPNFEKAVDSLHLRKNIDLYITGSNSTLLSGSLGTLLAGRYIEINMLPFSFAEFIDATGDYSSLLEAYTSYLQTSSFPYASELQNRPDVLRNYLQSLYDSVFVKDILDRNDIRELSLLQRLTDFVYDNIGCELSANNISKSLTTLGKKTDTKTIDKYLGCLCEGYLLYKAPRYNIRGKQLLSGNAKYYGVDMGLRRSLLGSNVGDYGRELENIVFLELLRRGFEVRVGKIDSYEIDFIATKEKAIEYIQVAASVLEKDTFERELRPLQMVADNHPKTLLTLDSLPPENHNGIQQLNALEWLLNAT